MPGFFMRVRFVLYVYCLLLLSCGPKKPAAIDIVNDDAGRETVILAPTDGTPAMNTINTGKTTPQQLISFARTAIGIPYKYASFDPEKGFDCSGFITYVFNHFGIAVPRASVDFTHVTHEVPLQSARAGDLILFTGTDSHTCIVGHMGIVITGKNEPLQFIHSTSGRANGVTISPLNTGYMKRFVKIVRIFPQNEK